MAQRAAARLDGSRWTPYVFIAPTVAYLAVFQLYPLLKELVLSFTQTSLMAPHKASWVGLRNYADLAGSADFGHVLLITALYTGVCVALGVGFGLATALLLDRPFWGRGVARALVTLPWAAPPVAVATIFAWMLNAQYGVANHALRTVGVDAYFSWLDDPALALPAILVTTVWQIFPFSSVVLLAALQGVSEEVREAAQIDGADGLNVFKAAVWPTIRPTTLLLCLFVTIWSLRRFDLIWVMTQGGPIGATKTLVIELYTRAFVARELGDAAAVGMVGLLLALLVTVVYFWFTARTERAEGRR